MGRPDVGLMTLPEMVDNARRIAAAVTIPVIADADTGYGNPINVIRTVHEYEAAGVAAIHIEDQVMPKKCGHMDGKHVIPAGEMGAKVRAAVAARQLRRVPDHRSHRRAGGRGAGGRARAGAGATARRGPTCCSSRRRSRWPRSRRSPPRLSDVPLLFNYAEGGKTPPVTHEFLRELGFKLVIFPISMLLAATAAIRAVLAQIRADGSPIDVLPSMLPFDEFLEFIGLPEIRELERRFADADEPTEETP